ncbi:MAG: glycoside hydrolase family 13 protein [Corynebacterium variabile]|uniref:glycoside hydrolase family 13 protein n=1 Tax=Corynebacterium variabile TaxID=1727 RepID=UPI0026478379|nr:glycoside hydrolase family 13 protein [Corynebacterium variabile]MDN6844264.1 glycoside hydrolase family 13 protein [Corynebacterium variabile]
MSHAPTDWWRRAVIYQVYPRSFADSDGDGLGDLPGITAHLPYLRDLGVDAVWISPFYPSPQKDAGYDVADYCDVDPLFGSLDDADTLIATAHDLGLRVIVDLVPNHTSDRHEWFQAALASAPGSLERDRYIFRDIDENDPDTPPNNWESNFGGAAWSKTEGATGGDQWYLHLFDSSQPDLNWGNQEVRDTFDGVLRFWLDRGVDGFRVDVAHGMIKEPGLPDVEIRDAEAGTDDAAMASTSTPYWDRDGVHDIYRRWRKILDSYSTDTAERIMVAEAWVQPIDRIARYVRPDEHHQAFNFSFLDTRWDAAALREVIGESYRVNDAVGAPTTWVLSNHDVIRHATRLALAPEEAVTQLAGPVTEPDRTVGLDRARAATTLMLGLPGSAYLYQGEELGLPEVLDIPDDRRQDPTFFRTRGTDTPELGRDGCRVPVPWSADEVRNPAADKAAPWLPQPEIFADLAVDRQTGDAASTLELYRSLLHLRKELGIADGTARVLETRTDTVTDTVAVEVTPTEEADGSVLIVANLGTDDWLVPADRQVIAASRPGVTTPVPVDCTVWLAGPGSHVE